MRRVGEVVVIRVNDDCMVTARKLATAAKKPLRTFLREIVEDVLREAGK